MSFVTHSMGGLVVRELLSRENPWQGSAELGRLVMLGPPNRGSAVAEALEDVPIYRLLTGEAGRDLTPRQLRDLPDPPCPFAIIAGGTGTRRGLNPGLPGDNDGLVLVENTRLDSPHTFLRIPVWHTLLMQDPRAMDATLRFLRTAPLAPDPPSPR